MHGEIYQMETLQKALEARSKKVNKVETTKAGKASMDVYAQVRRDRCSRS